MNRYFIHITLILFGYLSYSQNSSSIEALGRVTPEGTIKLRWAVSDPLAWQYMNEYGVSIERHLILENGKVVADRIKESLTREPLKPALLPDWETYMDDDFVAIAAQALYGESFEVDAGSSEMVKMMNRAKELENRFSFAMYACDHSILAAKLSGLYYEDKEVFSDQKYLYKIYASVPSEIYQIDTASVFIGLSDNYDLPAPQDLEVTFGDQTALISWNVGLLGDEYGAFWVERSADQGKTFQRISDKPFISTYNGEVDLNKRIFKVDSLPENHNDYKYRVIGISPFGDLSNPSDTVGGKGLPKFTVIPNIISHEILKSGSAIIRWEFPESQVDLINHFDILRENQTTQELIPVKLGIDPSARNFTDNSPLSTNYYVVQANDIYGRITSSFPYLVQLEDSIPPARPQNLQGAIDTLGRVYLNWDANEESDLLGYKLYRSNFSEVDFVQLDGQILSSNTYIDTINLKTLSETVYYRVAALDNRYNTSEKSSVLQLSKPDMIPPVSPVITNIQSDSAGIVISWNPSSSEDVAQQLLYRRSENESDWTLVKVISEEDQNFYYDKNVQNDISYAYTMLAVDDDNLESIPTEPITVKWIDKTPLPPVTDLNYLILRDEGKVKISWSYNVQGVEQFEIYKSINGGGFQLYDETNGLVREFIDQISANQNTVQYKALARLTNGKISSFSEVLNVNYKR